MSIDDLKPEVYPGAEVVPIKCEVCNEIVYIGGITDRNGWNLHCGCTEVKNISLFQAYENRKVIIKEKLSSPEIYREEK